MTRLPDQPMGEKHRIIAEGFTQRVLHVSDWDAPTPVKEWRARDVVGHLLWIRDVLGDAVEVGQPLGQIHSIDHAFSQPVPVLARTGGMLFVRRSFPLTTQGECLAVMVRPYSLA